MKISVLESGSWGTALAAALAKNGHEVTLHSLHTYRSELLRSTRENPRLPGVSLPENLLFEDGLAGENAGGEGDTKGSALVVIVGRAEYTAVVHAGDVETGDRILIRRQRTATLVGLDAAEGAPGAGFVFDHIVGCRGQRME